MRVDRKTVGSYRLQGKSGNHLSALRRGRFKNNLMEFLGLRGINVTIPVAEGQTFNVTRYAETGEVAIVYDIYSAGDIRADMPNGSDAKEYIYIQYMNNSLGISADGDILLDESNSPAEFPDFPCGKSVPANHTIDILGLIGYPVCNYDDGSNYLISTFVKLIKERETLFDEDRAGIPFRGVYSAQTVGDYACGFSLIGSSVDESYYHGLPLMFEPLLHFVSGEELLVYVTFALTGTKTLAADTIDLAAIMRVKVG